MEPPPWGFSSFELELFEWNSTKSKVAGAGKLRPKHYYLNSGHYFGFCWGPEGKQRFVQLYILVIFDDWGKSNILWATKKKQDEHLWSDFCTHQLAIPVQKQYVVIFVEIMHRVVCYILLIISASFQKWNPGILIIPLFLAGIQLLTCRVVRQLNSSLNKQVELGFELNLI